MVVAIKIFAQQHRKITKCRLNSLYSIITQIVGESLTMMIEHWS